MKETLAITKALADKNRLRILMMVKNREACVCQITEVIGNAPSTVSKHLSILKAAGLLDSYKQGRWIYYHRPEQPSTAVKMALSFVFETLEGSEAIAQDRLVRTVVCQQDPEELTRNCSANASPAGNSKSESGSESMSNKGRIMFLCTGNSCRSQIADGIAKHLGRNRFEIYSAGLEAHGLNPRAIKVMDEIGIDISNYTSDEVDPKLLGAMDYAITLCGDAEERCPLTPPSVTKMHWPFPDPAKATGTEDEIMEQFRLVRDAIAKRLEAFFDGLER